MRCRIGKRLHKIMRAADDLAAAHKDSAHRDLSLCEGDFCLGQSFTHEEFIRRQRFAPPAFYAAARSAFLTLRRLENICARSPALFFHIFPRACASLFRNVLSW